MLKLGDMRHLRNPVAATFLTLWSTFPVWAEEAGDLPALMAELADPEAENPQRLEQRIIDVWSRSGSRSMDLLLERGQEAMEADDFIAALEHFTALTDHAPDFAEGWNMRATVFYLMDRQELSIADIGRTLALNPEHFGALYGLGVILEGMEEKADALEAYRAAHALNPHREGTKEAIERLTKDVDGQDI